MIYRLKSCLKKIIPHSCILWWHYIKAVIANVIYGFPGKKLLVIAVAGTKGKTTTTNLIANILESSGYKVAMLSTANFQIDQQKWLNNVKLTTPSAFYVQQFLAKAVRQGCGVAILETSSHGLVQRRYWGVDVDIAVITNLTSDHLDYHKTTQHYQASHFSLINSRLKSLVINFDDENTEEMRKLPFNGNRIAFTTKSIANNQWRYLQAQSIVYNQYGTTFDLQFNSERKAVHTNLVGDFNVYNVLGAIGACYCFGLSLDTIIQSLQQNINIPGRLERINQGQDFEVIVDYAHSPESLRKVYEVVRPYVKGRLIAVLGGTGDRDKSYRKQVGELADYYADIVIITNEDPYSEEVEDIIDQVLSGVKQKNLNVDLFRIVDRKLAIYKAMQMAKKDDLVIITGKGCEQFIIQKDKKIPWDDRSVARQALDDLLM